MLCTCGHQIKEITFLRKIEPTATGCWLWRGWRDALGYGRQCHLLAHRVAWSFNFGDPGTLHVLHRCDNPSCVNASHLFLGTQKDNMRDMALKGRAYKGGFRGQRNGRAVFNVSDIHLIRRLRSEGQTQLSIASRYGVTREAISNVLRKKTWAHIEDLDVTETVDTRTRR